MSSYQYRKPHVKDKIGSLYLGKAVFILTGPECVRRICVLFIYKSSVSCQEKKKYADHSILNKRTPGHKEHLNATHVYILNIYLNNWWTSLKTY